MFPSRQKGQGEGIFPPFKDTCDLLRTDCFIFWTITSAAAVCAVVGSSARFPLCRPNTSVSVEQRKLYALVMGALI